MKKRTKRFADGGLDETPIKEQLTDEKSPPIKEPLPYKAPSLSDDQIAGMMKVKKLRQTYGPSQNERDRMERADLTAEATGKPAVHRSVDGKSGGMGPIKNMAKGGSGKSAASKRADGCATKGKTKGRFV